MDPVAAAIDIGSNGMRLLVGRRTHDGFQALHRRRAPVRLGHHTYTEGHLDAATVDDAINELDAFRLKAESLGVQATRAVATSAVREASDGADFVARARADAGIAIDVIDGDHEARLIHRALRHRIPWDGRPWLTVDLGGGSLEIALVDEDTVHWTESHPLGTVRCLEEHDDLEGAELLRAIHADVDTFVADHHLDAVGAAGLAATGGNINALASIAGHRPRKGEPVEMTVRELHDLRRRLESTGPERRRHLFDLRADRVDVIVPAAIIYGRVADLMGAQQILVPGWGLREGVLLDLFDRVLLAA